MGETGRVDIGFIATLPNFKYTVSLMFAPCVEKGDEKDME
jgi:hypothetical protein